MRCRPRKVAAFLLCVTAALAGCAPQQPMYLHNNGDMSHYMGMSATIDNPDVCEPNFSELAGSIRPFTVNGPLPKDYWELTLEKTIHIALENAKVMRQIGGQVQGPPTFLTSNLSAAPTIYDPAIADTDARFGPDAGLSLFDPTLTTDLSWQRNHEPRNVEQGVNLPTELNQGLFEYDASVSKTTATGMTLTMGNTTSLDMEHNNPTVGQEQDWQTTLSMEIRQPLLQGYGLEFNRIAGPGSIPGFNQGVLIARVNSDIALATFEGGVRNLVSDVETMYWELYYAYRNLDTAVEGRDNALRTWQQADALFRAGGEEGAASTEAQARVQFFIFRSTAEQAQAQLYQTESKLRYMMGIAPTDGRMIRPIDDPTMAKISFDWMQVQTEALARSVEIREQRWQVKRRELELIAAKNWLLPRVDLIASYKWNGMGDKLVDPGNSSTGGGAIDNLFSGEYQDWNFGVQGSIPLGFRKQRVGVTNAEYAVMRERAKLQEVELEVSHQIAYAIRDLDANRVLVDTDFNRMEAARRSVHALEVAYPTGQLNININVLLDAQRDLTQAESEYYRALTNYAKSISQVHYRKGSLLEYNGVFLTEGPWPAKAYFDARRRARERSAALYMNYGFTRPKNLSQGTYQQFSGRPHAAEEQPAGGADAAPAGQPAGDRPEMVPPPPGTPSGPAPAPRLAPPAIPNTRMMTDAGRGHDLGSLDLGTLGAPKAGEASPISDPAVQPAAFRGW
jgi:outer membrane protein TolC